MDEYLKTVTFAYNTTIQSSTQFSPFYLLYGLNVRLPYDSLTTNENLSAIRRMEVMIESPELAKLVNSDAQRRQKDTYDIRRHIINYKIGDLVLVYRPHIQPGQTRRLAHHYEGPYKVTKLKGDLVYEVEPINCKYRRPTKETAHVVRLKPYFMRKNNTPIDEQVVLNTEVKAVNGGKAPYTNWRKFNIRSLLSTLVLSFNCLRVSSARILWALTEF